MLTNTIPSYLNPPKTKLCLVDGGRETKRTEQARVVESVCTKQLNEINAEEVREGGKQGFLRTRHSFADRLLARNPADPPNLGRARARGRRPRL